MDQENKEKLVKNILDDEYKDLLNQVIDNSDPSDLPETSDVSVKQRVLKFSFLGKTVLALLLIELVAFTAYALLALTLAKPDSQDIAAQSSKARFGADAQHSQRVDRFLEMLAKSKSIDDKNLDVAIAEYDASLSGLLAEGDELLEEETFNREFFAIDRDGISYFEPSK